MRYVTCKWFTEMVKYKFGYNLENIYLNSDGSIYGATVGNCFWNSDDIEIRTGILLNHFRIINNGNLKLWKDLYGKKEDHK